MTWKHLGKRVSVMLSGFVLAVLVVFLFLIISSRSLEYQEQKEETPRESPAVPADGPTWTIILDPSESPDTAESSK